jgi:tRNA (guanine-N7-)-methyltransferase
MPKIRQHVNPLKSDLLTIAEVPRVCPPQDGFLEVELGSAESGFLIERARGTHGGLLVGVEIRREMVARADRMCAEAGVDPARDGSPVRNVFANIAVDLPRLFAAGSVRRFHINFPDPWFKSRQHKRRVVSPALVEDLARALEAGGEVSLMTDIFDIALEAMALFESDQSGGRRFVNAGGPWSFWPRNPWGARSRRERQCELEGQKIWRLYYRAP